jgi:Protein of unknown function (DUF1326)
MTSCRTNSVGVRLITASVCLASLLLQNASANRRINPASLETDSYDLKGVWSDACPCSVPCPCWYRRQANSKRCVNIQLFHIDKGRFRGSDLSGMTFILVGLPSVDYGAPSVYKIYSDRKSNQIPGAELFAQAFGLEPEYGFESVSSLQTTIKPFAHTVVIDSILRYDVRANGVTEEPLSFDVQEHLYPWVQNGKQWRVRRLEYRMNGKLVTFAGTNSLAGRFEIAIP